MRYLGTQQVISNIIYHLCEIEGITYGIRISNMDSSEGRNVIRRFPYELPYQAWKVTDPELRKQIILAVWPAFIAAPEP